MLCGETQSLRLCGKAEENATKLFNKTVSFYDLDHSLNARQISGVEKIKNDNNTFTTILILSIPSPMGRKTINFNEVIFAM